MTKDKHASDNKEVGQDIVILGELSVAATYNIHLWFKLHFQGITETTPLAQDDSQTHNA